MFTHSPQQNVGTSSQPIAANVSRPTDAARSAAAVASALAGAVGVMSIKLDAATQRHATARKCFDDDGGVIFARRNSLTRS